MEYHPSAINVSLKELVDEPLPTIPEIYIRQVERNDSKFNCSGINLPSDTLPIIDMSLLASSPLELEKMHSACKEWGFFQLVNHGVNSSLMTKTREATEGFFNLPKEEKLKLKMKAGKLEGYGNVARADGKFDWCDRLAIITNPIQRRSPHCFQQLPAFLRETIEAYISEMQNVAMSLVAYLGRALKIGKEVTDIFEDGFQSIRLAYYPPCPEPERVLGVISHSDAVGIAIVNQMNGINGLEIKKDGEWMLLNVLPGALVVNIGDIFEIISNGVYKSVEHRAIVNAMQERISSTFFLNPKFEEEIGPVISSLDTDNPPLYRRVNVQDFYDDYFKGVLSSKIEGKNNLDYYRMSH